MHDMYRNYVNMVCTRTMKNIVTLILKKKFVLSCLVFFEGSLSSTIVASFISFLFFKSGQWFLAVEALYL
jgi:hypothetical protein